MVALLNGQAFFDAARASLFDGKLSQPQVDGINRLMAAFTLYGSGDRRHLAYGLATSLHETGRRMQPVREGFAVTDAQARTIVAKLCAQRGRSNYAAPNAKGLSFYGRGDVQLTHETNYRTMGMLLGLPLADKPDMVLDPAISARILWEGILRGVSLKGDFTGKALEDFIFGDHCDYVQARRTVNGLDKADLIAGYARAFEKALTVGGMPLFVATVSPPRVGVPPVVEPAPLPPAPAPSPAPGNVLTGGFMDWLRRALG